jgi:hypothetical protein
MVVDLIEARFDIPFDSPLIRHGVPFSILGLGSGTNRHANMFQSSVTTPSWSETVRYMPEACLENWLQDLFDRALDNAVFNRWDPQGPERPWFAWFRD